MLVLPAILSVMTWFLTSSRLWFSGSIDALHDSNVSCEHGWTVTAFEGSAQLVWGTTLECSSPVEVGTTQNLKWREVDPSDGEWTAVCRDDQLRYGGSVNFISTAWTWDSGSEKILVAKDIRIVAVKFWLLTGILLMPLTVFIGLRWKNWLTRERESRGFAIEVNAAKSRRL